MLGALMQARRSQKAGVAAGVTLVELMVTLAITAVLAAIALPSLRDLIARKRVEGVAQALATDLRLVRAHQLQGRFNRGTAIRFRQNADQTCYTLYNPGGAFAHCFCDRAAEEMCGPAGEAGRGEPIRTVQVLRSTGVTMLSNNPWMVMEGNNALPLQGMTVSVTVAGTTGGSIRVSTNEAGVPQMCSISGAFSNLAACAP